MPAQLARLRDRATAVLAGFTSGQKTMLALALVALVFGGMFFGKWAGKPSYAPLFTDLSASDAAAITEKLDASKTPYQLADGGATVMVPKSEVYKARLDMSAKGLPAGGSTGYALLDKQGITTSEFRQRVDYQRALEGELSRTISSIDGVTAATVRLVIPTQDLFSEDERKPSASVLVKTAPGKTLSAGQVRAIVHLTSSSVEGLTPEQVTVADAKGTVLSAPGKDGMDLAAGDARATATRQYEDSLTQSVQDMLTKVLGPGHAAVQVRAELDFDETKKTSESYDTSTADKPINEATTKETFAGTGAPTGGILGPNSTPVASGGAGTSNYSKDEVTRNYAVGKVVEEVRTAPGTVKRLSVAVLLDSKAKGVDTSSVEKLVSAAAGVDSARGDTVAVDRMPFDQTAQKQAAADLKAAEQAEKRSGMLGLARTVLTVLLALFVLLQIMRATKRTTRTAIELPGVTPLELAPVHAAVGAGAVTATAPVPAAVGAAARAPEIESAAAEQRLRVQAEIGNLIERQPDEVAQLLRSWLADRRG